MEVTNYFVLEKGALGSATRLYREGIYKSSSYYDSVKQWRWSVLGNVDEEQFKRHILHTFQAETEEEALIIYQIMYEVKV